MCLKLYVVSGSRVVSCVRVTRCCVELGVSLGDMCLKLYVVSGSRAVSCVRVTLSRDLDVSLGDMCLNLYVSG